MNQEIAKHIQDQWGSTHFIEKVKGVEVNLEQLKDNESVMYGDGKTFHYRLTDKKVGQYLGVPQDWDPVNNEEAQRVRKEYNATIVKINKLMGIKDFYELQPDYTYKLTPIK